MSTTTYTDPVYIPYREGNRIAFVVKESADTTQDEKDFLAKVEARKAEIDRSALFQDQVICDLVNEYVSKDTWYSVEGEQLSDK